MSQSDQYYESYYGDDYYYVPDANGTALPPNDSGPLLLIVTIVCCFSCIAILPLLLRWGAQYDQYKHRRKNEKEQLERSRPEKITDSDIYSRRDGHSSNSVSERVENKRKVKDCFSLSSIKEEEMADVPCINADWPRSDYSVASSHASSRTSKSLSTFIESVITCHPRSKRHVAMTPNDRLMTLYKVLVKEEQIDIALIDDYTAHRSTLSPPQNKRKSATSSRASVKSHYGGGSSVGHLDILQESRETDIQPKKSYSEPKNVSTQIASADEVRDLRICCGRDALWKPRVILRAFDDLVLLFESDHETKRIVSLALPFTLSEVVMGVCDNIHLALISRYMGTSAVAAITAVDLFLSITGEFLGGIIDGQLSITSHALGVGNNYIAGQYVQQAQVLTTIGYLPSYALWWFCVYPATLWLGMTKPVAKMAQQYARVEIVNDWLDCMSSSIHGMYEVTDHEWFSNISDIVFEFFGIAAIVPTLIYYKKVDLVTLAYIDMGLEVLGIIWAVVYGGCKGWLKPFVSGWLYNFALFNTKALRNMVRTALPLMFGEVVAEAEWELLTIFAAHNGQSEIAAWGLMGSLWETFEAFHEGIGDAAEIRVAYHLGKGSPQSALMSGLKGAIIATATAFTTTSFLWIFGEEIPKWFSKDPTVQDAMLKSIPLMGVGNLSMVFGMVCWAIVGAQGRYSLATTLSFFSSWLITLPLAALFVYVFNFGIVGLVSSLAIGYSCLSMLLVFVMARSDWPNLSKIIQERNAITGEEMSSDSESASDDSSRSSSFNPVSVSSNSASTFSRRPDEANSTENVSTISSLTQKNSLRQAQDAEAPSDEEVSSSLHWI